jgi:ubiquinone/menaquinone biosynthesis C-methylase UbiE
MPARSPSDGGRDTSGGADKPGRAGQFGPDAYAEWRQSSLGEITETLEWRLIRRLAGEVAGCAVLDVGCGDGSLTRAFRRSGAARIAGCDADPRMVARAGMEARRAGAEIAYAVARAEQLPFRDDSFDLVTMITVLAFVPEPERALREIARVLKPGGRLVVGDLGKWSLWAASRRVRGWFGAAMWQAARFRSAGELRALAEAAQLDVERVEGAVFYPRSTRLARLMAPFDPILGAATTVGAAFIALRAVKPA